MRTVTLWVRTASTATLVAIGVAVAAVFVAANVLAGLNTGGPRPPAPATLSELTLHELGSTGPVGITANFRYADSLVPTTSLIPQASAGGSPLPLLTGAERPPLVRRRAPADGVPDEPGRHPARRARLACAHVRRRRRHRLCGLAAVDRHARADPHRPGGRVTAPRPGRADACDLDPRSRRDRRPALLHRAPGAAADVGPPDRGDARRRRRHRHPAPARRLRARPAQAAGRVRAQQRPLRRGRSLGVPPAAAVRDAPGARQLRRAAVAGSDRGVHRPAPARRPRAAELPPGQPLGRAARAPAALRPVVWLGRRPGAARRGRSGGRPVGPSAVGVRVGQRRARAGHAARRRGAVRARRRDLHRRSAACAARSSKPWRGACERRPSRPAGRDRPRPAQELRHDRGRGRRRCDRRGRRRLRLPGAQRRRQDDVAADDARPGAADLGRGAPVRPRSGARSRCGARRRGRIRRGARPSTPT